MNRENIKKYIFFIFLIMTFARLSFVHPVSIRIGREARMIDIAPPFSDEEPLGGEKTKDEEEAVTISWYKIKANPEESLKYIKGLPENTVLIVHFDENSQPRFRHTFSQVSLHNISSSSAQPLYANEENSDLVLLRNLALLTHRFSFWPPEESIYEEEFFSNIGEILTPNLFYFGINPGSDLTKREIPYHAIMESQALRSISLSLQFNTRIKLLNLLYLGVSYGGECCFNELRNTAEKHPSLVEWILPETHPYPGINEFSRSNIDGFTPRTSGEPTGFVSCCEDWEEWQKERLPKWMAFNDLCWYHDLLKIKTYFQKWAHFKDYSEMFKKLAKGNFFIDDSTLSEFLISLNIPSENVPSFLHAIKFKGNQTTDEDEFLLALFCMDPINSKDTEGPIFEARLVYLFRLYSPPESNYIDNRGLDKLVQDAYPEASREEHDQIIQKVGTILWPRQTGISIENLREIIATKKLIRAAKLFNFISTQLLPTPYSQLEISPGMLISSLKLFREFTSPPHQTMSEEEGLFFLATQGMNEEEAERTVSAIKILGNKTISPEEFIAALYCLNTQTPHDLLKAHGKARIEYIFRYYDRASLRDRLTREDLAFMIHDIKYDAKADYSNDAVQASLVTLLGTFVNEISKADFIRAINSARIRGTSRLFRLTLQPSKMEPPLLPLEKPIPELNTYNEKNGIEVLFKTLSSNREKIPPKEFGSFLEQANISSVESFKILRTASDKWQEGLSLQEFAQLLLCVDIQTPHDLREVSGLLRIKYIFRYYARNGNHLTEEDFIQMYKKMYPPPEEPETKWENTKRLLGIPNHQEVKIDWEAFEKGILDGRIKGTSRLFRYNLLPTRT